MTTTPPPVPTPPRVDDTPLESFLERAAPILAVERGINARSRVRLLSIARDVGLPDGEFDQAVRLLQRAPPKTESAWDRITDPFRRYLHAKIEQSTVKTFTPALENRVVEVALEKFHLTDEQAREAISQVTSECGVQRFSQHDCEKYVAELVCERIGDDEWLDDESVNRLRAAGAQWGLSIEEVDALIVAKAAANREGRGKSESSTKIILTVSIVAGVAVFLILAVLFVWGNLESGKSTANTENPAEEPGTAPAERPKSIRPPKWWDVELSLAQSRAKATLPEYRTVHERLCSDNAEVRGQGYTQLVALVQGGPESADSRDVLRQVVSASHALDPDAGAADKLRTAILAPATPEVKKLPASPAAYDIAFWSVEAALTAIYEPAGSDERRSEMAAALGKALGLSFDREKPRPSVEQRCYAALAKALYRQLAAGAAESPRLAQKLHGALADRAQHFLELSEFEQLDVGVLATVLAASPESSRDYEQLIAASIGSKDPLVVLKMLEIYERTKDPGLEEFLRDLLLVRVRATPKSSARADVSAAVRQSLGAVIPTAPTTAKDRWEKLRELSHEPLARRAPLATETDKILEETLHLAHLGTLACALAQQEPGFPHFDQLVKDGPPSLNKKQAEDDAEPEESARPEATAQPTAAQQRDLARYVDGLARYKDLTPLQRLTYTRGLAALAEKIGEIEPDQAVAVARFLLGEKGEDEQKRINDSVETLCRWKSVRLALADLLADPAAHVRISVSHAARLFSAALRHEVNLASADWPQEVREQLVKAVLADLHTATPAAASVATGADRAAEALVELYQTRAKLLGLGPAQFRAATTPALHLEVLATHEAAQLGGAGGRPADTEFLNRLPHEMAVVDYLGSNDVRRTVLAQRVWLRLLSISLSRKRPEQASAAKALVDELIARDLKASHVLLQLRDGEATALQMWLLHAPKE